MAGPLSSFHFLPGFMVFSIDDLGKSAYRRWCE
jgi:hypothetical protein